MKRFLQAGISVFIYLLILLSAINFDIFSIIDIQSILLVIIGTILLTLSSYRKGISLIEILETAKSNLLPTSYLITFLQIFVTLSKNPPFSGILREIALCCRPILYGLLAHIILTQYTQQLQSSAATKSISTSENPKTIEDTQTLCITHLKEAGLTSREIEIVIYILDGLSNKKIGEKLYISEATVKKHTNNLYKKLNIKNRSELKEYCRQH